MPTVIPLNNNDIVEVRVRATMNDQALLNVLHYRATTTGGVVDWRTIAGPFATLLKSSGGIAFLMNANQSEHCDQSFLELQIIHPTRYLIYTSPGLGAGKVTDADNIVPQNVSAAITKRGILSGRGYTGTLHFGGLAGDAVAGGYLTENAKDNLADLGQAMINVMPVAGGVTFEPIIYSVLVPEESQTIVNYVVQPTARVQRRRTVGLGI